jgi:hypothetical protein
MLMLTVGWLLSVAVARAAQPPSLQFWFVDSLLKVFPTDRPEGHRLALVELWAARNQHVSLQLAIRSAKPLAAVTAEAGPLRETSGHRISAATIQPVGYVVVGSHTPETPRDELVGEAPGWYPDPLLAFPLDLEGRRTYPMWVSIHVPPEARPGVYRGLVVVRSGRRELARAAFRLRVVGASVPPERTLKVTNWFSLDDKLSRQFYGVAAFSPGWWTLVENVASVMAEHRQNVILTPLMELAQPRAEAGAIRYDFENFDRWVETFRKAGAIGFIEGGHLLDRAGSYEAPLQVPTFQLAGGQVERQVLPPDDPRVESFLAGFLSALNTHLEEKGLKPVYFQHILDEAHGAELPYYAKFAGIVRRYLPGVPTLDAVDAAHMPEELQKNCDVWVPQLGRFDDQMKLIDQRCQTGHEVWFYTCLFPRQRYLNRLMDYPLLKVRLLHWLNFRYNLTGFLHWGGNYWTPEPRLDTQPVIDNNTELLPSGDAFILYPDRPNKSVRSSIRLEVMREGIEDYEMLRALREKNPAEAERIAAAALPSFTEYVRDPAAFHKIERSLLKALSSAQLAGAGTKPKAKSSGGAAGSGGRS